MPGQVRFMVDEVALLQVFLPVLRFSHVGVVPPILYTNPLNYMSLVPEGQTGKAWEFSQKAIFFSFGNLVQFDIKVVLNFFSSLK
jgi:hypothetical protein